MGNSPEQAVEKNGHLEAENYLLVRDKLYIAECYAQTRILRRLQRCGGARVTIAPGLNVAIQQLQQSGGLTGEFRVSSFRSPS